MTANRSDDQNGGQPDVRFWRDPDLGGLELRYSRYDQACFGEHTHDTYSVGIILDGTTEAVLRGEPASPRAGHVVLIPPDEIHACNPVKGSGWAYHMFYPDKEWLRGMALDFAGNDVGYPSFIAALVEDDELFSALHEFARSITEERDVLEKQSAATHAFSMLLQRHCNISPGDSKFRERTAVTHAKALLEERLEAAISLDELAAACGLSRYHLLRVFKEATSLPPHAWRTQQRIHHARRLLREGLPIAEVAHATGFTDQSHFSTTFKKAVGTTPLRYQQG